MQEPGRLGCTCSMGPTTQIFHNREVKLFWRHALLGNIHRNEQGSTSDAVT